MFLLVRADGTIEPLPGVFAIENDGTGLFCLDAMGAIVGRYTPQEVLLYGDDSRIPPLLAEYADSGSRTQKLTLDGHAEPCCAVACDNPAALAFIFKGPGVGMKISLCRAHEGLIDDRAKSVVLDDLDLRRLTISRAEPL